MEVISLAIFGLLIVMSPGSDFVLMFKNSAMHGRKAGIITALGIGSGVCIHVTYSVIGISHFISQNIILLSIIKYAGASYLIYLGISGLRTSRLNLTFKKEREITKNHRRFFIQGFICNTLNPKTMLFFLSIFSQLISPDNGNMPFVIAYGSYIIVLHSLWFIVVACLVTSGKANELLKKFGHRVNQTCSVGLIGFGTMLVAS
ncbi:LysE family translocator [Vibrio salinus]|uniref:LysE family translocator n=1 Tax=Vibrio salinus TaxID=2899784 RepID=UPI001E2EB921|nr:LysE family translocator [Vibrio salinus]MCE0494718.1 LysE family translocator [Vibrio salinus]